MKRAFRITPAAALRRVLLALAFAGLSVPGKAVPPESTKILNHFLALSDIAAKALVPEPPDRESYRKNPGMRDYYMFFVDSYAVRALTVAYDLTGRERYWDACRTWSDRMVRHQEKMIPRGAYYMNYHRKPGESQGQWYVADSGSIAMAVLATAARSKDPALRKRYTDSVRSYLRLVADKFVRASGGVTDGYFDKSDKEWWCSTALYAAAALQFHGLTGEAEFRRLGLNAVNWLLKFQYADTVDLYKFEDGAPTTIFYVLEAYSSALPYLEPGSERQRGVARKFSQTVEWIAYTQTRKGTWDYSPDNWGVKLGGLPSQMLIYLSRVCDDAAKRRVCISSSGVETPFEKFVGASAERALDYFASLPINPSSFTQGDAFVMLSEAERLCPGELYQKGKLPFPYRRYTEPELPAAGKP
ncbi:MAG: hypothetical protein HXY20_15155 [Acidobacteria bacterium]|nr:hypothetical protein [Acidobacteriota bacterium]